MPKVGGKKFAYTKKAKLLQSGTLKKQERKSGVKNTNG